MSKWWTKTSVRWITIRISKLVRTMFALTFIAVISAQLGIIFTGVPAVTNGAALDTVDDFKTSEIDWSRVDENISHVPNPGFEIWNSYDRPADLYTDTDYEGYSWLAQSP
jgi:hypothetical protein